MCHTHCNSERVPTLIHVLWKEGLEGVTVLGLQERMKPLQYCWRLLKASELNCSTALLLV